MLGLKSQKGGAEGTSTPTVKVREREYPRPGRHDISESICKIGRNFHSLGQKCQPYGAQNDSFKLPPELFRLEAIALFQ